VLRTEAGADARVPRYERKFLTRELSEPEVRALLRFHPALFSEIYAARYVDNLYLDTHDRRSYFDSVGGTASRSKVRIRWYGDLFGLAARPRLEFKIKRGLVGWKETFPLAPLPVDGSLDAERVRRVLAGAELPGWARDARDSREPVQETRYRRRYFRSADGRFRATIDSELEFYIVSPRGNRFLHRAQDHVHVVLELKYGREDDARAERVSSDLPLRLTRSSKYVMGLDQLRGRTHDQF
jgi:hypothetical protein